jgi:hypothetical protein
MGMSNLAASRMGFGWLWLAACVLGAAAAGAQAAPPLPWYVSRGVDGATRKSLGLLNAFTLYVLPERTRGYPNIVAMRTMGAFDAQYTTYRFNGSEYVERSTRDVKTETPDSLSRALDRIPPWRPPRRARASAAKPAA